MSIFLYILLEVVIALVVAGVFKLAIDYKTRKERRQTGTKYANAIKDMEERHNDPDSWRYGWL